jgi:hypothetical protein
MKNFIFIFFLFSLPFIASAQDSQNMSDKMEAKKVVFLTAKLDLSQNDAKIFWPIYNEYLKELTALRKERTQKMISFRKINEIENMSDDEIQTLIQNDFAYRQKGLDIEKKYYARLKSQLDIKIVGKFYRAQESYKKELLQQFRNSMPRRHND